MIKLYNHKHEITDLLKEQNSILKETIIQGEVIMLADTTQKILNLWKYQEFFSQKPLKSGGISYDHAQKGKNNNIVSLEKPYKWAKDNSLSDIIEILKKSYNKKFYDNIVVTIGVIKRRFCVKKIAEILSLENDEIDEDNTEIAVASIALNTDGIYLKDSIDISPICWAMGHIKENQNNVFTAYEKTKNEIKEKINELFDGNIANEKTEENKIDDENNKEIDEYSIGANAITYAEIQEIYEIAKKHLWKKDYFCDDIRFECSITTTLFNNQKDIEDHSTENTGLCMHFYIKDLEMIQKNGLNDEKISNYINALTDKNIREYNNLYPPYEKYSDEYYKLLYRLLSPERIPLGKWPSQYNLSVFQQLAVNIAVSNEYKNVFSVNGPPGTGKTTLLKDIAAANVVEKAKVLSSFDNPNDAFIEHSLQTPINNFETKWYSFSDSLQKANQYSMMVVCNNNAAAENISMAWPNLDDMLNNLSDDNVAIKQIKKMFTPSLSTDNEQIRVYENAKPVKKDIPDIYFTYYAQQLLNTSVKKDQKAWGLISAALGNKANIKKYCSKALMPYARDFASNNNSSSRIDRYQNVRKDFLNQYNKVKQLRSELNFIKKACDDLEKESSNLNTLKNKKTEYELSKKEIKLKLLDLNKTYPNIDNDIKNNTLEINKLTVQINVNKKEIKDTELSVSKIDEQIKGIKASCGLIAKLFKTKSYKENLSEIEKKSEYKMMISAQKEEQNKILLNNEQEYYKAQQSIDTLKKIKSDIVNYENALKEIEKSIIETDSKITETQKEISLLTETINSESIGEGDNKAIAFSPIYAKRLLAKDDSSQKESCHNSVPWITAKFDREREKLFFLAVKLTKAFVINAKAVRENLCVYTAYTRNNNKEKVNFKTSEIKDFIVPVLQTLFLFTPVISSTLASVARMFADAPQKDIIGYLFVDEAGQAVPYSVLGAMYRSHRTVAVGDPKQIFPVITEENRFINGITDFEGMVKYNSSTISVQNFIDALNPFGTYIDNEKVGCPLITHRRCASPMFDISNNISYDGIMINCTKDKEISNAQWINCIGKEGGGNNHYVPDQGEKVINLLKELLKESDDIFIITPFKTVQTNLIKQINKSIGEGELGIKKQWVRLHIGTVHTFQGKEANTVIFVLGCDQKTKEGAISFVGSNIVNVAASRAKHNFYVIGDAKAWEKNEYIMKMKNIIDVYAIKLAKENENSLDSETTNTIVNNLPNSFTNANNTEIESEINIYGYIEELKKLFKTPSLTSDEMAKFNIQEDDLNEINENTKNNLLMGIKLYTLLQKVYQSYAKEHDKAGDFDATCCSILFCKFIENHLKDVLLQRMKEVYPNFMVHGKTNQPLSCVDGKQITMGCIKAILNEKEERDDFYNNFIDDLGICTKMRNNCCHENKFIWKSNKSNRDRAQDYLLCIIFGYAKNNNKGLFQRVKQIRDYL